MTTLREVARRAGVSTKTASNAINGYAGVSDRVRRRVQEAVEELGYRPNQIARALRGARGDLLTLVVPAGGDERMIAMARQVISAAERLGYEIVTDHRDANHRSCLLLLADLPGLRPTGQLKWAPQRRADPQAQQPASPR